jgi:hypothetical protein
VRIDPPREGDQLGVVPGVLDTHAASGTFPIEQIRIRVQPAELALDA